MRTLIALACLSVFALLAALPILVFASPAGSFMFLYPYYLPEFAWSGALVALVLGVIVWRRRRKVR